MLSDSNKHNLKPQCDPGACDRSRNEIRKTWFLTGGIVRLLHHNKTNRDK